MQKITELLFLALGTLLCACGSPKTTVVNPILSGADPWVTLHEGRYYYCCSMGNAIGVSVSDEPQTINPPQKVWTAPTEGWNRSCVWAPEMHFFAGRWYIYYAAGVSGPPFIHQRTGVLESVSANPFDGFTEKSVLFTGEEGENIWSIDFSPFEYKGRLYGVWSGWEKNEPTDATPQHLYIAAMSDPWTISSARVKISSPDASYELIGDLLPINEGPEVLQYRGNLFVVYSCGQSWLETYKLAWLKLTGDDLLEATSWTKSPTAVFEGNEEVYGVGHASFTTSRNGKQHYIIYHTKKNLTPGWDRAVHIQPFTFDRQGEPVFGRPATAGKKVEL